MESPVFIAYIVVAALLTIALVGSAVGKFTRAEMATAQLTEVGAPLSWLTPLGALEVAGGLGLIAGILYPPLGMAAAVGVDLYFLGAIGFHIKAGDFKGLVGPTALALLALAALVLRILA